MYRFLWVVFILIMFVACNDSSSSSNVSDSTIATQVIMPSLGISGVTELRGNYTTIPSYDNGTINIHFIYIPQNQEDDTPITISFETDNVTNTLSITSTPSAKVVLQDNSSEQFYDKIRESTSDLKNKINTNILYKDIDTSHTRPFVQGDIWSDIYLLVTDSKISAVATAQSTYADIYVEEGVTVTDEQLQAIGDGFDYYYPTMITTFAEPNDVDNNGKIIIMLADFGEDNLVAGFFYPVDKYPRDEESMFADYEHSNYADIFYINTRFLDDIASTTGTIVHEFQHMLIFDARDRNDVLVDDTWINEGLSVLTELLMHPVPIKDNFHINNFLNGAGKYTPSNSLVSLINWIDYGYGMSGLFALYLHEQYPMFIKEFYASEVGDVEAIEQITGRTINDVFLDYAYTLALSNKGITDDERYNFKTLNFNDFNYGTTSFDIGTSPYPYVANVGDTKTINVHPYGMFSLQLTGNTSMIKTDIDMMGIIYPWGE